MNPFSVRLKRKNIQSFSFWGRFIHFFPHEVIFEVRRVWVRKSNFILFLILFIYLIILNFVNATSMESCFGMSTFYINFCYYQLNQYGTY